MKSKIILLLVFACGLSFVNAQTWQQELEKHKHLKAKEIISKMEKYFDVVGSTRVNKYHKWVRYREQLINHIDSDGFYTEDQKLKRSLLKSFDSQVEKVATTNSRHFHGRWEHINPNRYTQNIDQRPIMGRVNCIAIPPSNGNIIYAGASTGGVWKSYNHGATWTPLWDGMVQMGVSDIIIDETNENHILVVTGDANGSRLPYGGVYHSYDAGSTWTKIIDGFSTSVFAYRILQSKTDPYIFYIATTGTIGSVYTYDINQANIVGDAENSVTKPTGFDIDYLTGSNTVMFAATRSGLLKKTGTGPWQTHDVSGLPTGSWDRTELAMAPNDPNVMYYMVASRATGTSPSNYGIYKSVNGGDSFFPVYDTSDPDFLTGQCTYNFSLSVDPDNSSKIYVGTVVFYSSTNSGNTLQPDNINLHPDNHGIYSFNNRLYICTDGGLSYREIDDTDFINISNGLNITQFYKMDVSGNRIVGGTQDNGTLFWNEGDEVGVRKVGLDGFDCLYHPVDNDIVFTSTQQRTVRSTNNGDTNVEVMDNRWAAPIQFWPGDPTRMISYDNNDMRLSRDTGQTWPDSIDLFTDNTELISGFSQCAVSTNTAYACNIEQVMRSDDFNSMENSSWNDKTTGLNSNSVIRNILVHPNDCGEVYVTLAGYQGVQVYKSEVGGDQWDAYAEGLNQIPVYCIYYDHVNGDGFYIGTEFGVYYRNSSMSEWIPFSTYLPRVQVFDLNVTDTHVYAATFGRGIWKSEGYKSCVANLSLSQTNDPTFGTSSGKQIHKASNTLYSNRIIRGKAGTEVIYQAGNFVNLTSGFHAKSNNEFIARAAGCDE